MADIWPPLPWTTPPRITAQVPEERVWPGGPLYFRGLFYSHSLASHEYKLTKLNCFCLAQSLATR